MPIFLPRSLLAIALTLGAISLSAANPLSRDEMQRQFAAWDKAIHNGLLYNVSWSDDGKELSFDWQKEDGAYVRRVLDCETSTVREIPRETSTKRTAPKPSRRKTYQGPGQTLSASHINAVSPDKVWKVSSEGGELTLESSLAGGISRRLASVNVAEKNWWGTPAWSPDSKYFAIWLLPVVNVAKLTVREASTGKETTVEYPVPGDTLPESRAWVFSVATGEGRPVPESLIKSTYSTRRLDWTPDSTRLRTEYVSRGFTGFGVLEFDTKNRTWRKAVEETDPKFSFYNGLYFRHDLDADTTLWISERTGWSHLYRIDLRTGKALNAVTSGEWVMRRVLHVDAKAGFVLVEVLGRIPGENPYQGHLCRVNLDGNGFTDLTPDNAQHDINLSPCARYFLDTASRPDLPPTYTVRRTSDGSAIATLGTADISRVSAVGWTPPIPFHTKDRNGRFDIWGLIHRPKPFDPTKRYPVLECIYAGPHDSFTPTSFTPWWNNAVREPNVNGFYVVQIDGLGTRNRGREFHQRAWQDLRDAGLPDRIAWMKAAAKKEPQMDLSRVGIFGGSAGGQNAVFALLDHGDFYRAGVADCGCYDNRVDKVWWNEQWLGWPPGPAYDRNRCANYADKLRNPLLITVGEIDTNVPPRSSFELRDALIAAGKADLVEFKVAAGAGHGAGERDDMRQLRLKFFLSHLGGPLPR